MKNKILWILVSCLMIVSLVIASCGPTEEEEEEVKVEEGKTIIVGEKEESEVEQEVVKEEKEMEKLTLTTLDGTTVEKMVEKPKYGGTLTTVWMASTAFDVFLASHVSCGHVYLCNEELLTGDWRRGPCGTGENDMRAGFGGRIKMMTGWLAESWEIPDEETMVFHIRQGVHWWNKPPVNGREMTADDIVWTMNRAFTMPKCYFYSTFTVAGYNPTSVKALDKWTVEVKVPPEVLGIMLIEIGDRLYQFPPEPTEVYGDMSDWRNLQGTGPWMLTDFVPSVSYTYDRNPNYWQMDPLSPENQLPYPDELITLDIPDASTRLAAFRSGKLDLMRYVGWEDAKLLLQQCPGMEYVKIISDMPILSGRVDKLELPFQDIRVRQALNLAVNQQELIDDYYEGDAEILSYPIKNYPVFQPMYIPLEEQPEAIQELFTYNPEKARQLLKEAGYPNGFKTQIVCRSTSADFLSIIKEYFLDIGVDMEIKPLESGAWSGTWVGRTHEEMMFSVTKQDHPYMLLCERRDQFWNSSLWEDPRIYAAYERLGRVLGVDDAEVLRIMREINPILLGSAWGVWLPSPYAYNMWWPWVHNWGGAEDMGYCGQGRYWTFPWIDESLKMSMGY